MPVITINKNNFLKGESTSNYLDDGGYSPDSGAFDIDKQNSNLGLLIMGRNPQEFSTNLDDFFAASELVDNSGGKYYTVLENRKLVETDIINNTHTVKVSPGAGKTYNQNVSSVLKFAGKLYITSDNDIWEENYSTFAENDYTWWTVTKTKTALTSSVPHILFEFNNVMFVTNGNKVFSFDGTTARDSGSQTLTLDSSWIIRSVMIYGNQIYLACTKGTAGNNENFESRFFVWDGYTANAIREVRLNTRSVSVVNDLDGLGYFGSASGLYNFDGSTFGLKKYLTPNNRHCIATVSGLIYFASVNTIYCYSPKRDAIYKVAVLPTTIAGIKLGYSNVIHAWTRDLGSNKAKFYKVLNNTYAPTSFYSNYYEFDKPAYIRRIEILFADKLSSGADYTVYLRDEVDAEIASESITYSSDSAIRKWRYNINKNVDAFRLQLLFNNSANKSVRWIKIYWDTAENSYSK